ncbi:IS3 family transposase [Streptomyces sp. NPDC002285]
MSSSNSETDGDLPADGHAEEAEENVDDEGGVDPAGDGSGALSACLSAYKRTWSGGPGESHPRATRPLRRVRGHCRALGVSESWYYKWRDRELTAREVRRQHLAQEIEEIFHRSGGTYGSPTVFIELVRRGWRVSVNTVAKVMAELELAGRRIRRRRSLTKPGKRPAAPDFVRRDFSAEEPDLVWVGDMTEIETGEGKLYLATVIDLFSRRLLGYAMGERHDAELVVASLNMAAATRGGDVRGVIMHTDRGSEGGFNWSLQHLVGMEVLDGASSAGSGPGVASEAEVSGASEVSASCRGGVLGGDRQGPSH